MVSSDTKLETKVILMTPESEPEDLDLARFFPYRISVLYDEVSRSVAQVYAEKFALSRHQWRVMATLGGESELTAKEIGKRTRMEKMPVSRAVAQLEAKGFVSKEQDSLDKRHQRLTLTPTGLACFRQIVPRVIAREAFILSALTDQERGALDGIIDKLISKSRELQSYG